MKSDSPKQFFFESNDTNIMEKFDESDNNQAVVIALTFTPSYN